MARHASRRSSIQIRARQFSGAAFTGALINNGIAISMDGKGAWRDNVSTYRRGKCVHTNGATAVAPRKWSCGPAVARPSYTIQGPQLGGKFQSGSNWWKNLGGRYINLSL